MFVCGIHNREYDYMLTPARCNFIQEMYTVRPCMGHLRDRGSLAEELKAVRRQSRVLVSWVCRVFQIVKHV